MYCLFTGDGVLAEEVNLLCITMVTHHVLCCYSTDRRCETRKVNGSLPPYFKWVSCANYAGQVKVREYVYDEWSLPVSAILLPPCFTIIIGYIFLRGLVVVLMYTWTLTTLMFQCMSILKWASPREMECTGISMLSRLLLICLPFLRNVSKFLRNVSNWISQIVVCTELTARCM